MYNNTVIKKNGKMISCGLPKIGGGNFYYIYGFVWQAA